MMVKWIKAPLSLRAFEPIKVMVRCFISTPVNRKVCGLLLKLSYEEIPARKIFQPHGRSKIKLGDARLGFLIA